MIDDIKSSIKVWLNDCLLHAKTENDLFSTLNFFIKQCQKYGLTLHASKYVLFAITMRYCGTIMTKHGVRFDPKTMKAPQTICELRTVPTGYSMSRQSTRCEARYPTIRNVWPLFKNHW
jgi:hypothetical protein